MEKRVLRYAALIVGGLAIIGSLFLAWLLFMSGSDPATKGLDVAFAWAVLMLFGITVAPGFLLAATNRAPRTAFALVIAFPIVFLVFFGGLAIYFAA